MTRQRFEIRDDQPQAALLKALSARALQHLPSSDWREILDRSWHEPIPVRKVAGSVVCVQCPSWGVYPNLSADVEFLARRLGGYVDPWTGNEALVLLQGPDDALNMATELRSLATTIRLHVGISTGICAVARILCSGRKLEVLLGEAADEAAAACALAPAGTFRMSAATFERLTGRATSLDACMLQTEYDGENVVAICVTPPPLRGGEQLSSFAGLGLM